MPSLEHRNNRDNCRGDITHKQPIFKQISYRPYRRIASFNGYFYKEYFLDWLLDLEDWFDYENICDERKVKLTLYKFRKYALRWWEWLQSNRIQQGEEKIHSWPKMKINTSYQLLSYGLWWNLVVYKTRLLLAKKFILELFWRAPPLRKNCMLKKILFLKII